MLIEKGIFYKKQNLVYGKSLSELKKMSILLYKRMCELQRLVATRRNSWRHPSYSIELTGTRLKLDKVNKLIDLISGEDEKADMERFPLERFIEAQENNYAQAIEELRGGRKISHWMWYVFPQLRFLGHSDTAYYYGIADEQEAREYCANAILYDRYIECCKVLEGIEETNPERVMCSNIDALKLCSSLTLFHMVDDKNQTLYQKLIDKFYHGRWDRSTMDYLARRRTVEMCLDDQPFQQIKNGEKTIEVRLYDEKRRRIQVENYICFTHSEDKELRIQARVVALYRYNTFTELFETEEFEQCGFNGMSAADATKKMYEYYTKEEEKKWGVLGIEIQLIE